MQNLHDTQHPTSPLRERRRRQTARDIQLATLNLAAELGLDAVTTEAIAKRAGISVRTFFNYFLNKDDALLGSPPRFLTDDIEAFASGSGSLLDDLRLLMRSHLSQVEDDREVLRLMLARLPENPNMRQLHQAHMMKLRQELSEIIERRAPDLPRGALEIVTLAVIEAGRLAIENWADGEDHAIGPSIDAAWKELQLAGDLLTD